MVIFNELINICNFFAFILIMVNIGKQINKQTNKQELSSSQQF